MSEDINVTDGTVLEALNNKADRDLLNLTEEGEKHFANPSLSNLDELGQAKFDEKANVSDVVNKAGDTMTGNLLIKGTATQHVVQVYSNLPVGNNPTTSTGVGKFQVLDKNNVYMMQVGCERNTAGVNSAFIRAHSPADQSKSASITISADRNNTFYTSAPTPAAGDNSTKIATTAYCVNMRCTTKATTTSSASTTRPAWVVQNYVSGTSWYRVWSDGWIEQGGGHNTTAADATTITFLKAFSNTNYTFTGIVMTTNASYSNGYLLGHNKTAKGCTITLGNINSGSGYSWYACGY